jgi:hypothetical protein
MAGGPAQACGVVLSEENVDAALRLVTSLARQTMPGTLGAGLTVLTAGHTATTAASDPIVERADGLQYGLDEGPCLTACRDTQHVRITEIRTETRWPRWTHSVEPLGVRASLSSPVVTRLGTVGAIKVYFRESAAYDQHAEELLTLLAQQAAILLTDRRPDDNASPTGDEFTDALEARDVIRQAEGILMARDGVLAEGAFELLIRRSQQRGTTVRDVARELVDATARQDA